MQTSGTVILILREKNPDLCTIAPAAMVYDAIEIMAEQKVGALPVVEGGRLVGMISERDYTRKVVLVGKSSKNIPVAEIMTRNPVAAGPDQRVGECMELMTEERVRHLPVVVEDELIGILSIGDLVKWIISAQDATIDQLTKYVFGEHVS